MRKLLIIPILTLITACNCQKKVSDKTSEIKKDEIVTNSTCPSDGKCTIEVIKNKSLEVKSDEFGSNYYNLTDNMNTSVVLYRYNRNVEEGLQDASYKEEIIFEINNNEKQLSLSDRDLQKTKMIFGRICFCRGQTGYYKVQSGKLFLENQKENIILDLNFKITEVPQVINSFNYTISK
ncbi:hypothetical protein [Flavobacterium sp.]|uniref:hypothetical protein n=1 Tax=Flavobacterium sp. TaxID=239 RepID=UPI002603182D|nr:hypothetical protein [Flavobacterium sp.]